jgi:hypothetical protein
MHQYPLHRISYCADDKGEKRFFSFIAKEADSERHVCFVFVSDKLVSCQETSLRLIVRLLQIKRDSSNGICKLCSSCSFVKRYRTSKLFLQY